MDFSEMFKFAVEFDAELAEFSLQQSLRSAGDENQNQNRLRHAADCAQHKATGSKEMSLAASEQGQSVLARLFEVVAHADGKVSAADFKKQFRARTDQLTRDLGVREIEVRDGRLTITLNNPLEFAGEAGKVKVGDMTKSPASTTGKAPDVYEVSFTPIVAKDGSASMKDIKGITASSIFETQVHQIDLEPREGGYVSAKLSTDWANVKVCATRSGDIKQMND